MSAVYKVFMGAGYATSCVLGVLLYTDAAYMKPASSVLLALYMIDSLGCCFGMTCMRSIPPKNVLCHHIPVLLITIPVLYAETVDNGCYREFHQILAAASVTSGNESLWVMSNFFSKETLEGKLYKGFHACVTTCALTQFIGVAGSISLSHVRNEPPPVALTLLAILASIATIQLPLLVNVLYRLVNLLKN